MSTNEKDVDDSAFAMDSDYGEPRDDGRPGPPDDWRSDSWFNYKTREWWYRFGETFRLDPPSIQMLGHNDGDYYFVTAARELRRFRARDISTGAGMADLFAGDMRWAVRHYPAFDREGKPTKRPSIPVLLEKIINVTTAAKLYDGRESYRSVGVWRGPDGAPLVHIGSYILHAGKIYEPGVKLDGTRYVLGPDLQAPAYRHDGRGGFTWDPCAPNVGHTVMAHLDEWHWASAEARELCAGGLWCDMLGDAPLWKPHKFLRAKAGSGKTTLLKYIRALLGGAAHNIERSYSKAHLEERYGHKSAAILLEEAEGERGAEAERVKRVLDLVLLLSDDGAVGGRYKRDIDVHGSVTLVATLKEDWRSTLKSRIVELGLKALKDRTDGRALLGEVELKALETAAAGISPGLRARAMARYDLFRENLVIAKARVLELGGSPRDADTLGHLIAGWACMTGDAPLEADEIIRLERFTPFIVTLSDAEDGADDASDLFNTMLGLLATHSYRGGDQLTIGQLIARAREPDAIDFRRTLLSYGLRLEKLDGETWPQAWLAVANKHPGLDHLFAAYPEYQGGKRAQIICELRRAVDGVLWDVKPTDRPLRFAGPQSRAWLVPPALLPSRKDEEQPGPAPHDRFEPS